MQIVFEDNHLLAVDKPAGVLSQPDITGDASAVDMGKQWLREKYGKTGDVYLALLHRLDRPTSGMLLFARTDKAAARMSDDFRQRRIGKSYLAIVSCEARPEDEAQLVNHLKEGGNGCMEVYRTEKEDTKRAELSYLKLAETPAGNAALLRVELVTGLKHQIRAQLAFHGLPVVGDFRYGPFGKPASPVPVQEGRAVLLHSYEMKFTHPVNKNILRLKTPPPEYWRFYVKSMTPSMDKLGIDF